MEYTLTATPAGQSGSANAKAVKSVRGSHIKRLFGTTRREGRAGCCNMTRGAEAYWRSVSLASTILPTGHQSVGYELVFSERSTPFRFEPAGVAGRPAAVSAIPGILEYGILTYLLEVARAADRFGGVS
ncbi:hypothetical protein [Sphingomonas albertensis]|uniref:Uncharacterized protein n=1 Tax=Sphingomonas albertensis TaxID=2762591 RepID=A0ABR7AL45_9SPHN|nr:hypothetical protein [Sphingomonas albertensis]MBC3941187.1 hypothetical protein [Sphingomonas albertensis]